MPSLTAPTEKPCVIPSAPAACVTEVVASAAALERLEPAWNDLAERFANPLLQHEFYMAAARAFCPPQTLSIVTLRRNRELLAAAPLCDIGGRLELLGGRFLGEPSGLLYRDDTALALLADALLGLRRPLLLARLDAAGAEAARFAGLMRGRALCSQRATPGSPWLPITGDWHAFEAGLTSRRRNSLRRAQRRAEAIGEPRYEIIAPGPAAAAERFDDILRVEAAGWKGRGGTALEHDAALRRFFRLYSQAAAARGLLRLGFLRLDERIVAIQIALVHARRLWVLKIGYDESFAACSPGVLLMHAMVQRAFVERLEAVEFLGHCEPWLRLWTERAHDYVGFRAYPFSLAALAALGRDLTGLVLRRAGRRGNGAG